MPSSSTNLPLLSVRNLRTYYYTDAGFVCAVDGVSFEVPPGGTVGIAGESGCGKTQTALSILGLIDETPGIVDGQIWIEEDNLLDGLDAYCTLDEHQGHLTVIKDVPRWRSLHHRRLNGIRGHTIAMVFQEPKSSLIPYRTVGEHLRETIAAFDGKAAAHAYEEPALDLLEQLRFAQPRHLLQRFPHELSGGESQRIMLGLALLGRPRLLIADEPTTLLDAITQRRVLDMLSAIVQERSLALLLISHNLTLLRLMVDRIVVLFGGMVVEQGSTANVLQAAAERGHPYTRDLLCAVPDPDAPAPSSYPSPPAVLKPTVNRQGCRYFHRCRLKDRLPAAVRRRCRDEVPPAISVDAGHTVACWAYEDAL